STIDSLKRNIKLPEFELPSLPVSISDISLSGILSNLKLSDSQNLSSDDDLEASSEHSIPLFPPPNASLPQPANANHITSAPLTDKIISNSAYLRAEIPNKLGHWVSSLWTDQGIEASEMGISSSHSKDSSTSSSHSTFMLNAGDWI